MKKADELRKLSEKYIQKEIILRQSQMDDFIKEVVYNCDDYAKSGHRSYTCDIPNSLITNHKNLQSSIDGALFDKFFDMGIVAEFGERADILENTSWIKTITIYW